MKILFLAANPQGTTELQLRNEANKIHRSLQKAGVADEYRLIEKWAVDSDTLRRALLDEKPDIVHFSGHGTGAEGLMLEGQDGIPRAATGDALANLFKIVNGIKPVRCVLLNACYAEEQAKAIFRHIDNVVGMRRAVKDDAAIAFSIGFYDGLGRKCSVQTAFDLGCVAIQFETASFSQKTRKAVVVLDEVKEALEPIPDHLIPILFSRETVASTMQKKSLFEALEESGISKDEALRQYRGNVQRFFADRVLTPTEAFQLSTRATALRLTEAEANRILEEEQKRIKQAKENYKQVLLQTIEKGKYPFNSRTKSELKELQYDLSLNENEIEEISRPIIEAEEEKLRKIIKRVLQEKTYFHEETTEYLNNSFRKFQSYSLQDFNGLTISEKCGSINIFCNHEGTLVEIVINEANKPEMKDAIPWQTMTSQRNAFDDLVLESRIIADRLTNGPRRLWKKIVNAGKEQNQQYSVVSSEQFTWRDLSEQVQQSFIKTIAEIYNDGVV